MKYLLFILISFFTISFANEASAVKIPIDIEITDASGNIWILKGWIDVKGCCPPRIEHWDVWVTDGFGKEHHFTGIANPGPGSGQGGNNPPTYQMHLYDINGLEIPIDLIPSELIIIELEQIAHNNPAPETAKLNKNRQENHLNIQPQLAPNTPNPFNDFTQITYQLPSKIQQAHLVIYNINGQILKSLPVKEEKGTITLAAEGLVSGTYIYALEADGKVLKSRKMMIQK